MKKWFTPLSLPPAQSMKLLITWYFYFKRLLLVNAWHILGLQMKETALRYDGSCKYIEKQLQTSGALGMGWHYKVCVLLFGCKLFSILSVGFRYTESRAMFCNSGYEAKWRIAVSTVVTVYKKKWLTSTFSYLMILIWILNKQGVAHIP